MFGRQALSWVRSVHPHRACVALHADSVFVRVYVNVTGNALVEISPIGLNRYRAVFVRAVNSTAEFGQRRKRRRRWVAE
jgi:hypothetical protein